MQNPESAILGTGWSFPPTFSRSSASVEMVSDDTDIRQSLRILFSTYLGERIMLPRYGSQLGKMVFRAITTTLLSELRDDVRQAILNWEGRIDVDRVTAEPDASVSGLVNITVYYTIRQTNARNNLVYPFYLEEATLAERAS